MAVEYCRMTMRVDSRFAPEANLEVEIYIKGFRALPP